MNALTIAMGLLSINGERVVVGEETNLFVRDSSVERPLKRAKLSNNYIFVSFFFSVSVICLDIFLYLIILLKRRIISKC